MSRVAGLAAFTCSSVRCELLVRVQGFLVDVFMVHYQQPLIRAVAASFEINREKVHAIVVHAHRLLLLGAGVRRVRLEFQVRPGNWSSPGQESFCRVARRHNNIIGGGYGDRVKAKGRRTNVIAIDSAETVKRKSMSE